MSSITVLSWWHVGAFLAIVLLFAYIAEKTQSYFFAFVTYVSLVLVSGLRHGYVDTRGYRQGFEAKDPTLILNWDFIVNGEGKDKGFTVLNAVIKLFTDNGQIFLLIMAIITVGCLFWALIKRAPEMTLVVFLFICSGCYLDTMNGVRQALVSAILFAVLPDLILNRKAFRYAAVVLVMSTIHASALLFIPIYFIADKKAWSKATWMIFGVALLVFVFFNSGVGSVIVNFLEGTSYGNDYGEMLLNANTSVNVTRVAVAAVPMVLSFLYRHEEEKDFPLYHICFNISLINVLVWLFATKVLYFYRLAMYFQPYMILLLCYELFYNPNAQERKFYKIAAVVCFLVWHLYSLYAMGDHFFVGYLKY